jgi:hypothetical protein
MSVKKIEMMLSEGNVKMVFVLDGIWMKLPHLLNEIETHGLKIPPALALATRVIVDGLIVKDRYAIALDYKLKIEGKQWSVVSAIQIGI